MLRVRDRSQPGKEEEADILKLYTVYAMHAAYASQPTQLGVVVNDWRVLYVDPGAVSHTDGAANNCVSCNAQRFSSYNV